MSRAEPTTPLFAVEGLDEDAKGINQLAIKARKMRCCGIMMLCGGIALAAFSVMIPYAIDRIVRSNVLADTRLTRENEFFWSKQLVGGGDIEIFRDHYLYTCANLQDVMFTDAEPLFDEIGPFVYRENNIYSDYKYGIPVQQGQILSLQQQYKSKEYNFAVQATLTQSLEPVSDRGAGAYLDTPGQFVNQAALKYWHTLTKSRPKWEAYIELLHRVLVHDLRDQTLDLVTYRVISKEKLASEEQINRLLLPQHPVSESLASAIFNDPNYGLGSQFNYPEWTAFIDGNSLERLIWQWELRTYFGLSHAQIEELAANWFDLYTVTCNEVIAANGGSLETLGFLQWSQGSLTQKYFGALSIQQIQPGVVRHPEISYFRTAVYDEQANFENRIALYSVSFRKPMPDLFSTVAIGVTNAFDPDPSSLFNVATMRQLCMMGEEVPNILKEPEQTLNKTFTLPDEWDSLAQRLGLADDRHLYMLWLWMEQVFAEDLIPSTRHQEVPENSPPGLMSREGAHALKTTITTMKVEVPLLALAAEFANQIEDKTCFEIYLNELDFKMEQASELCTQSKNFSFENKFDSSFALLNVYLFKDQYNPEYYHEFMRCINVDGQVEDKIPWQLLAEWQPPKENEEDKKHRAKQQFQMQTSWPFYDAKTATKLEDAEYLFTKTFPKFAPGPDKKFVDDQSRPVKQTISNPWEKMLLETPIGIPAEKASNQTTSPPSEPSLAKKPTISEIVAQSPAKLLNYTATETPKEKPAKTIDQLSLKLAQNQTAQEVVKSANTTALKPQDGKKVLMQEKSELEVPSPKKSITSEPTTITAVKPKFVEKVPMAEKLEKAVTQPPKSIIQEPTLIKGLEPKEGKKVLTPEKSMEAVPKPTKSIKSEPKTFTAPTTKKTVTESAKNIESPTKEAPLKELLLSPELKNVTQAPEPKLFQTPKDKAVKQTEPPVKKTVLEQKKIVPELKKIKDPAEEIAKSPKPQPDERKLSPESKPLNQTASEDLEPKQEVKPVDKMAEIVPIANTTVSEAQKIIKALPTKKEDMTGTTQQAKKSELKSVQGPKLFNQTVSEDLELTEKVKPVDKTTEIVPIANTTVSEPTKIIKAQPTEKKDLTITPPELKQVQGPKLPYQKATDGPNFEQKMTPPQNKTVSELESGQPKLFQGPKLLNQTQAKSERSEIEPSEKKAAVVEPKLVAKKAEIKDAQTQEKLLPQDTAVLPVQNKTIGEDISLAKDKDQQLSMKNQTVPQSETLKEIKQPLSKIFNQTTTVDDQPKTAKQLQELESSFDLLMYSTNSSFEKCMKRIQASLAANMTSICASELTSHDKCAFSNITFAQWVNGMPLTGNKFTSSGHQSLSYVEKYANYTKLSVSPELGYFFAKSNRMMQFIAETHSLLRQDGLFSQAQFAKMMLKPKASSNEAEAKDDSMADYLKYIALNVGFDGLFTKRSPRQMIEGYDDARLEKLSERNLFEGGLAESSSRINLGRLPDKSRVTLLMGNESSNGEADARKVIAWIYGDDKDSQDLPYITIPSRNWQSPSQTAESMLSPHSNAEVTFQGTDGVQFHPNLSASDDKTLQFFSSEYATNLQLKYNDTSTDWFENLELLVYHVKPDELNFTRLLGANGTIALENSYVGVESKTGVPLIWNTTAFYSYSVDQALINLPTQSTLPLAKVSRNFAWTEENVHNLLDSSLLASLRWKWSILATALACGLLLSLIGIFLLCRASKESERVRRLMNVISDDTNSQVAYGRLGE